jgi:hypothetical protein
MRAQLTLQELPSGRIDQVSMYQTVASCMTLADALLKYGIQKEWAGSQKQTCERRRRSVRGIAPSSDIWRSSRIKPPTVTERTWSLGISRNSVKQSSITSRRSTCRWTCTVQGKSQGCGMQQTLQHVLQTLDRNLHSREDRRSQRP